MVQRAQADRTPSLNDTIRTVIEAVLTDVHTCLPAEVVSYDAQTQKASVKPQLKRGYDIEGQVVTKELPVIPNVPVVHPRSGNARIHIPLQTGDNVLLMISERSLDKWKAQGGIVSPDDRRKFNLTDAFAVPGGYPFTKPFAVEDATALEIRNDAMRFSLLPSGKMKIQNSSGELIERLGGVVDGLIGEGFVFNKGPLLLAKTILDSLKV